MNAEPRSTDAPDRPYVLLEAALAAALMLTGAVLFVAMPSLLVEGGIPEAQDFTKLSPIFFPRLAFGLLGIMGLSYLISILRRLSGAKAAAWRMAEGTPRVAMVYLFALLYPLLMPYLGFVCSSFLLLGGIMLLLGKRVWWQVMGFSLLAPVAIRFLFERMLSIALPLASIDALADLEEAVMRFLVKILL